MRPLRRKSNIQLTHNPITSQERVLRKEEHEDILSDHGSIVSDTRITDDPLDCGCYSGKGGVCFECGNISCKKCHKQCRKCNKPVCPNDYEEIDKEKDIYYCTSCFEEFSRKQKMAKVGRFFSSLFVGFEDTSND